MPTIAYVNVFTGDLARAVAFFEQTLGLAKEFADPKLGYASFVAGPVRLGVAVAAPEQAHYVGRQTGIGFDVADLDAEYARLVALGVGFEAPPQRYPWGGYMALVKDPDSNIYYLDQTSVMHG